MRPTVFLTAIITLAGVGGVSAQDKDTVAEAAQTYRTRCVNCHQPPDLTFATDRAWLDQVHRTGWLPEPPTARAAMIAFLKTDALPRPQRVTTPPPAPAAGAGILTATFAEGSVLLKGKDGTFYRLGWKKDDADRRRALPAGDYMMTGYTLVRPDGQGKEWFLGASGKMIRKLTVRAGEEQPLALQEFAHVHCRARPQPDGVQVQGVVQGEHHSGLTIYRDGKRITLGYRVTDAKGKEVAAGSLDYGWGGGAAASCKLNGAETGRLTAELVFEKPPFPLKGAQTAVVGKE